MENASKALIIAGGMLIALMVASLFVYLFTVYGNNTKEMYSKIYENQKTEALNQYTKYEGSSENTIYDVVSVINKAQDNNNSLNLSPGDRGYITVAIVGGVSIHGINNSNLQNVSNENIAQLLQAYSDNGARFSCNVTVNDEMVSAVSFKVDHYST